MRFGPNHLVIVSAALAVAACGVPPGSPPSPEAPRQFQAQGGLSASLQRLSEGTQGRPVLLVHGRNGSVANFRTLAPQIAETGRPVYAIEIVPSNADPRDMVPLLEQSVAAVATEAHGHSMDIVAHSMGGLLARAVIKQASGSLPVRHLIMLGTPNHGTVFAHAFRDPAARQLRPLSPFLTWLNAEDESPGTLRYTSIYSKNDTSVQPATSARLDGAFNHGLWGPKHSEMVSDSRAVRLTLEALAAGSEL